MGGRGATGNSKSGRRNGVLIGHHLDHFGSGKDKISKKQKEFDRFRFQGMDVERESGKYYKIGAVSADGNKLLVSMGENHVKKTPYGYAVALSENKVAYVKDWQVQTSYRGGQLVLLDKQHFKPTETKYKNPDFEDSKETTWNDLKKAAQAQKNHLWKIK